MQCLLNKMKNIFKKCIRNNTYDKDNLIIDEITFNKGTNNILISAPHAYNHLRNNKIKKKETNTKNLVKIISEKTKCHIVYINKNIKYDPNTTVNNNYLNKVSEYIINNNIEYFIDIHGSKNKRKSIVEIGTNDYLNVNEDIELIEALENILVKYVKKVEIDNLFKSSTNTLCYNLNKDNNIETIQLEIKSDYRKINSDSKKFIKIINALCDFINYIERRGKMEEINYSDRYDEILEIKPSFGYKRELGNVYYNQVGLEIEVSINYSRENYSFIRKLLKKIKFLVGDNGYFTKDGTVLGDYSFEIVMDPLYIDEIKEFYTDLLKITDFSKGAIEISKEKNCGIHMNFNQYDVTDLSLAHKKLTSFVSENSKYFEANNYKQFKFIWDINKYIEYQRKISSKYVWVNYLDKKLIEIRNIKADITSRELINVINNILSCLYYDKDVEEFSHKTFETLDSIYDTAFDNDISDKILESVINNEFLVLSLTGKKAKLVTLDEELIKKIKDKL